MYTTTKHCELHLKVIASCLFQLRFSITDFKTPGFSGECDVYDLLKSGHFYNFSIIQNTRACGETKGILHYHC